MREEAPDGFNQATWDKFMIFANAHHEGDVNDAMERLLFCHKYMWNVLTNPDKFPSLKPP